MQDGLLIVFGLVFTAMLAIKHFKGGQLNRTAAQLIVFGFAALIVGGFLAFMVGMGSRKGALIIASLFSVASGGLLTVGLFMEFLGGLGGVSRPAAAPPQQPPAQQPPAQQPPAQQPPAAGGEPPSA